VTKYNAHFSHLRRRASFAVGALAAAGLIAACGSSNSSNSTITVGNENTADQALVTAGSSTTATATSTSTKTPTSGPLATKPVITPLPPPPPTKLVTKDLIVGTGAEAKTGSAVTVNYVGQLYSTGKEFDSSWKRNETFPFTLGKGQVIAGWEQGVVGMKVGGRRELIIPPSLAYGIKGSPPTIPPNATLVFVIDLLASN
jgi:peptidylprolyl isomerase